jgi:hypothetical protein
MVRHLKPRFKVAALSLLVLLIAWLAGKCFLAMWEWAVKPELWPSVVALAAGVTMTLLALLIAKEISVAHARWMREQEKEDSIRCLLPDCDSTLRRPFIVDRSLGGGMCAGCFRRVMASEAAGNELPAMARKAGA